MVLMVPRSKIASAAASQNVGGTLEKKKKLKYRHMIYYVSNDGRWINRHSGKCYINMILYFRKRLFRVSEGQKNIFIKDVAC